MRDQPGLAGIFFSGSAPPPAEAFGRLREDGYRLESLVAPDMLWALQLTHHDFGSAQLGGRRDAPDLSTIIEFATNLSPAEKAETTGAETAVWLQVPARRKQVLHDRKNLLRIARHVMGEDGVVVVDMASQLPWSRSSLEQELAHEADLDVEALYCLHAVYDGDPTDPEPRSYKWLHTHGLGEVGAFDIDVVAPHPEFVRRGGDIIRAVAAMALEGRIGPQESQFRFAYPGGEARLVPSAEFQARAHARFTRLRDDDDHADRRSVLCEPGPRRLLGIGKDRPEPLRSAQRPPPDQWVSFFSDAFTVLMAQRASATVGVMRSAMAEFDEFGVTPLVKLATPTPSGGLEHMWFEVHEIGDDLIDASLQNEPFEIPDMHEGDRGTYPVERLTDWMIFTPAGPIHPRSQVAARLLREHADEIRAAMRAAQPPRR